MNVVGKAVPIGLPNPRGMEAQQNEEKGAGSSSRRDVPALSSLHRHFTQLPQFLWRSKSTRTAQWPEKFFKPLYIWCIYGITALIFCCRKKTFNRLHSHTHHFFFSGHSAWWPGVEPGHLRQQAASSCMQAVLQNRRSYHRNYFVQFLPV